MNAEAVRVLTLARDVYAGDEKAGVLESIRWAAPHPGTAKTCCRIFKAAFLDAECSLQDRRGIAAVFNRAIKAARRKS